MQELSGGTWSFSERRLLLLLNPLEEANASGFLRRHGFDLAIARDSQSAITSLQCRPADAAIIDVALPSENGYAASLATNPRSKFEGPPASHIEYIACEAINSCILENALDEI